MEFPTKADEDAAKKDYLMQLQEERKRLYDAYQDPAEEGNNPKKHCRPNHAYNPKDEFQCHKLNLPANAFPHLIKTVSPEPIGEGRQGAILVHPDPEQGTPMVRSTTQFTKPAQIFQTLHHQLANEIRATAQLPLPLNNCLVELFDNQCTETPFESKQAQDLAFCEESAICLFSCYKDPNNANRKLVVESKIASGNSTAEEPKYDTFEIPLEPNSVVVWSLGSNSHFRHKIVLDQSAVDAPENDWMGFTFRTSSTCIQYQTLEGDEHARAYFTNGMPLVLLQGDRACSTTHRLKELENTGTDFLYPSCMMSTISPGDLLPPVDGTQK